MHSIATLTGFSYSNPNVERRIITLVTLSILLALLVIAGIGILIQWQLASTYMENYENLRAAGFNDLLVAPRVIQNRLFLFTAIVPMIVTGVVLVMMWKVFHDLEKLSKRVGDSCKRFR